MIIPVKPHYSIPIILTSVGLTHLTVIIIFILKAMHLVLILRHFCLVIFLITNFQLILLNTIVTFQANINHHCIHVNIRASYRFCY